MTGELGLTRRTVMGGALAGAATLALPAGLGDAWAAAADAPMLGPALEPELITVTDTSFVAWWRTDEPVDTTVRLTPLDGPGAGVEQERRLEHGQYVHVARVDGLTPGTRYRYELWSGGRRVSLGLGAADPGVFRTLTPPSGRKLATIAVLNDLHVGEKCAGTLTTLPDGSSFPPCNSVEEYPDYAYRMVAASLDELRPMDIDLVIANGDLTDRGREDDIARALAVLRGLDKPLLITRGNHDRRLAGACDTDGDCLRAQAWPEQPAGDGTLRSVARVGRWLTVVGLDSCDPDTGAARLDLGDQPTWLDAQLTVARDEGRDAIVAFHHPILPGSNGVPADKGGDAVLAVLARHDHVRLVLHGHTHGNKLSTHRPIGDRLPFLENGAAKEYPGGYALLHVHEDGIMRTFHRPVSEWSRTWVRVSAQQAFGLHPTVTRGDLRSRAFVTAYASRIGADEPQPQPQPPTAPDAPSVPAPENPAAPPAPVAPAVTGAGASQSSPGPRRRARFDVEADGRIGRAALTRRGLAVDVHVDVPARATLRLTVPTARGRRVTVAKAERTLRPGTVRIRVRAGSTGRTLLRRASRALKARLEVEVRPSGGGAVRRARRAVTVVAPRSR